MSAHRVARLFGVAALDRLKNSFVMDLAALRASRYAKDAQSLLPQESDDGIQQMKE